jgi:hypothetical protein
MADIGFNPPGLRHDRVLAGVATVTGIKFGHCLVMDTAATGQHRAVKTDNTAGEGPLAGVCVTQTDPTNGSASGDSLEVCDEGVVEVLLASSNAITKGDLLINSGTAGQVKKLGGETTPWILGVALEDMSSQSSPVLIACKLGIYQHA